MRMPMPYAVNVDHPMLKLKATMRTKLFLAAVLGGIYAAAIPLSAQVVRGTVVESGSSRGLAGALMVLTGESGEQRVRALSDAAGSFRISAPGAGRYKLRVERVGFQSVTTPVFELREGETVERTISAAPRALALEGITVQARSRCTVRPQDGQIVASLWEEAHKALKVTAFAEDERLFRFQVLRYVRTLDPRSMRVLHDSTLSRLAYGQGSPFTSLPAKQLLARGFVERTDSGVDYRAPDAHVLLSDEFLDAYCFRLAEPQRGAEDLVGLSFEPAVRNGPSAVRGTLWLDRKSLELRFMEFGYTRVTLPTGPVERLGGRVEFEALPSGAWIVRRWWIRMPLIQVRYAPWRPPSQRMEEVIGGIREEGGEIQEVAVGGRLVSASTPASVSGVVYDSSAAAPLVGATVSLLGTNYTAPTDSSGRYSLEGLPEGNFSLSFSHAILDRYRISPEPRPISLRPGAQLVADLGLAPDARARGVSSLCLSTDAPRGAGLEGVLVGEVLDSLTRKPIGGAQVVVSWSEYRTSGAIEVRQRWVKTDADAHGRYVACWVPSDKPLSVRALHPQQRGAAVEVPRLEARRFAERNLTIPLTPPSPVLVRLTDSESGRPISGATVEIPLLGLQGRTNQRGLLSFGAVAPGVRGFLVRHPNFGEHRVQITVEGDQEYHVRIPPAIVALKEIEVVARSRIEDARRERGRRMDVMTRDQIESVAYRVQHVGDLARQFTSLQVRDFRLANGEQIVCIESGRGDASFALGCKPVLLMVDDLPVMDFARILSISPSDLESVEYMSAAEAGGRYGTGSANGVLIVYTRGNGPYAQRTPK